MFIVVVDWVEEIDVDWGWDPWVDWEEDVDDEVEVEDDEDDCWVFWGDWVEKVCVTVGPEKELLCWCPD